MATLPIIEAIDRDILLKELVLTGKIRTTRKGGNEIYIVDHHTAPNVVREVGRLREITFRASGGGTGLEIDLDTFDISEKCYRQLVVWSPEDKEIIGGYRFIECNRIFPFEKEIPLSTAHYFDFTKQFITHYLPHTIELGRSFVQPMYQPMVNPKKGLFALDNIWDGLGAIIRTFPEIKYFFGKVTMYPNYTRICRDILLHFMHLYFPDKEQLMKPFQPLSIDHSKSDYLRLFSGTDFKEDYKILNNFIKENGEFIPPLMSIYMNLSSTMKIFGTAVNADFGNVEETGILVTIKDIYIEKKERHLDYE
jgi:hypothetical protein